MMTIIKEGVPGRVEVFGQKCCECGAEFTYENEDIQGYSVDEHLRCPCCNVKLYFIQGSRKTHVGYRKPDSTEIYNDEKEEMLKRIKDCSFESKRHLRGEK